MALRNCGVIDPENINEYIAFDGYKALAKALRPVLRLLFPAAARHENILEPLSANVSANLLGLGNAATPMGIKAAKGMASLGDGVTATNELCRTTSAGNISLTVTSPSAAPRVSAEKTSALPNTAQMPTAASMSGTASVKRIFTLPPSA